MSSARDQLWADATRRLPIVPAQLGADAGLIGAAAVVRRTHPEPSGVNQQGRCHAAAGRNGNDYALYLIRG